MSAPNPFGALGGAPAPAPAPVATAPVEAFAAPALLPPTAAPAQSATAPDPFARPDEAASIATRPRLLDCRNRLIIVRPTSIERDVPSTSKPGQTYTKVVANIIVIDGGPIQFGGNPEKIDGKAHDQVAQVPLTMTDVWLSGRIAGQVERFVGGQVLGRVKATQASNNVISITLDPASDADNALARQYLASSQPFAGR